MEVVPLKVILLIVMTLVSVASACLPIKVLRVIKRGSLGKKSSYFLSLLSCLSGGVFLAVCLLDILPDALESLEKSNWDTDYPLVPLFAGIGFFFVYLVEAASEIVCGGHSHDHEDRPGRVDVERKAQSVDSRCDLIDDEVEEEEEQSIFSSLALIMALVIHVALEGFAFGVQDSLMDVTTLFLGIIFHKAIVGFSVGMRLFRAHPTRKRLVLLLLFVQAAMNPLGGGIGIAIQGSHFSETGKEAVTAVLMALSLGVFFYITFFEILGPEHAKHSHALPKWAAAVVGFALIAAVMVLGD